MRYGNIPAPIRPVSYLIQATIYTLGRLYPDSVPLLASRNITPFYRKVRDYLSAHHQLHPGLPKRVD